MILRVQPPALNFRCFDSKGNTHNKSPFSCKGNCVFLYMTLASCKENDVLLCMTVEMCIAKAVLLCTSDAICIKNGVLLYISLTIFLHMSRVLSPGCAVRCVPVSNSEYYTKSSWFLGSPMTQIRPGEKTE